MTERMTTMVVLGVSLVASITIGVLGTKWTKTTTPPEVPLETRAAIQALYIRETELRSGAQGVQHQIQVAQDARRRLLEELLKANPRYELDDELNFHLKVEAPKPQPSASPQQ